MPERISLHEAALLGMTLRKTARHIGQDFRFEVGTAVGFSAEEVKRLNHFLDIMDALLERELWALTHPDPLDFKALGVAE